MGVPVEIAVAESEEQLRMQMTGENMSLLIGRRGETLDQAEFIRLGAAYRELLG